MSAPAADRAPRLVDGALWLDGRPRLLLAGEYPYYRDDPALWAPKLRAMRRAGLEVVSFYVPWRHHEVRRGDGALELRFAGPGNRDLVGFLEAIAAAGLLALPKPGPFVHAELPLGGLPDRVSPSVDPERVPALSATGEPLLAQRQALPSAHDPAFLADAGAWLRAVGDVLRPFLYPTGPLVAVQIGNEGFYGETALSLSAADYSPPALEAFARRAPSLATPRGGPAAAGADGLRAGLAWAGWTAAVLADGLETLADRLGLDVPALSNFSPPPRDRSPGRHDAWLARGCRAWRSSRVRYAYTSWTGDVARDPEALLDYVLAAKAGRGPNLEENWSLGWIDPACGRSAVPIHKALLGLACGATGIDVYTACATGRWGPHLAIDRDYLAEAMGNAALLDPPYGEAAPIDLAGEPGPSHEALRLLLRFLAAIGPDLALAQPEPGPSFCAYSGYAALGAWDRPAGTRPAGRALPPLGGIMAAFVRHALARNLPFALADAARPPEGPLVVPTGFFMAAEVQAALAARLAAGAPVLLLGELPTLDERLAPCRILAGAAERAGAPVRPLDDAGGPALDRRVGELVEAWTAGIGGLQQARGRPDHLELRRLGPGGDDLFVFLLNLAEAPRRAAAELAEGALEVALMGRGAALVRVRQGRLAACYVKGVDEASGDGQPVSLRLGAASVASTHPCDLALLPGPNGPELATEGGPPANRVTLALDDPPTRR